MFAPVVLSLRLSYLTRTEVVDGITDDFRLSFLAGTRNLVLDLRCALADIVPSLR